MKWIVITSPVCFAGEALFLRDLAEAGVDAIHLRKPESDRVAFESLLEQLEPAVRRLMVTHDYFELAASYGLRGVHLNRRHPEPPAGWTGQLSCSCHSFEEVARRKGSMDYVFLSPVFNSISKQGYEAAFTDEQLDAAARSGLLDHRVMALGGITPECAPQLRRWHFGGGAMLGCIQRLAPLPPQERLAALRRIREMW